MKTIPITHKLILHVQANGVAKLTRIKYIIVKGNVDIIMLVNAEYQDITNSLTIKDYKVIQDTCTMHYKDLQEELKSNVHPHKKEAI